MKEQTARYCIHEFSPCSGFWRHRANTLLFFGKRLRLWRPGVALWGASYSDGCWAKAHLVREEGCPDKWTPVATAGDGAGRTE